MKISQNGIDFIKEHEGFESMAYMDSAGVWTVGYGHTEDVHYVDVVSKEEAEEFLQQDLLPKERSVNTLVNVQLNQNQYDALVSFVFNIGETAFADSTCLLRLNEGDYEGAAEAMKWFNKITIDGNLVVSEGLENRRAAEALLFKTPIKEDILSISTVFKNPLVIALGQEILSEVVKLVKSVVVPKAKRVVFEEMSEKMQEFGEFILEQKEKVESTETTIDDEAYKLSKEAFRKFLDEGEKLYQKL